MNIEAVHCWKSRSFCYPVFFAALFFVPVSFVLASSAFAEAVPWQAPASAIEKTNPIRYDVESVSQGKALFTQHCMECHGYWGEGDGIIGLSLNDRPANLLVIAGRQSTGAFAWKIAEGRNDMPSFRHILTEEEIWYVVNFIDSLENEIGSAGQPVVIRRCANCHGVAGKSMYEPWPDLPEMSQQEIERKLFAHRKQVIEDSTMSQVTFDLTDEEIKEAARYYAAFYREDQHSEGQQRKEGHIEE